MIILTKKEKQLAIFAVFLALVYVVMPYWLFHERGSFLFWVLTTLLVLATGTVYTRDWNKKERV